MACLDTSKSPLFLCRNVHSAVFRFLTGFKITGAISWHSSRVGGNYQTATSKSWGRLSRYLLQQLPNFTAAHNKAIETVKKRQRDIIESWRARPKGGAVYRFKLRRGQYSQGVNSPCRCLDIDSILPIQHVATTVWCGHFKTLQVSPIFIFLKSWNVLFCHHSRFSQESPQRNLILSNTRFNIYSEESTVVTYEMCVVVCILELYF